MKVKYHCILQEQPSFLVGKKNKVVLTIALLLPWVALLPRVLLLLRWVPLLWRWSLISILLLAVL